MADLPEPAGYRRSTSENIYTAAQLRDYAAAQVAEAVAEIARLRDELRLCCELKREYQERAAQVAEAVAAERAESARLRQLLNLARDDYNTAAQRLQDIGDYAHDHSTGPAVPDALWEVRSMAYGSGA